MDRTELQQFAMLVAEALENISTQLKVLADQIAQLHEDARRAKQAGVK